MRIQYYPATDSLYVYVADRLSAETDIIGDGIQADFDCDGCVIGVEIEHEEFYASYSTLDMALMNLTEKVTTEERRQMILAFDQILAGKHKLLDPVI
jgi:uncharacterized protein YuzE